MLDGISDSFGDGHLEIEKAIVGEFGDPSNLLQEPSGFGKLGKVGTDPEMEEPVAVCRSACLRHGVSAFHRGLGFFGTGEHPKVRVTRQSHDLKKTKDVTVGRDDSDPAASAHPAKREKQNGQAATIEIGTFAQINEEAETMCTEGVLDGLVQCRSAQMVHIPYNPDYRHPKHGGRENFHYSPVGLQQRPLGHLTAGAGTWGGKARGRGLRPSP
jgi:hypothetical protein